MKTSQEHIRVASSKEVMIVMSVLLLVSILICLVDQTGGLIEKKLAGQTQDVVCEIVKPQTVGWAIYLMPIVCIISLIIYPMKAKEKGLWN